MANHDDTHAHDRRFMSGKLIWVCFAGIAVAVIALTVFKISLGNIIFFGILLACPLTHFFIMKDGGHKH